MRAKTTSCGVVVTDGERLLLVYESDGWRVDGSALDLYSQETPEAAIASFVRAFDNKRYDVLWRFVPESKREGLSVEQLKQAWEGEQRQQVEQLTQALEASLPNLRVEVLGTRSPVPSGTTTGRPPGWRGIASSAASTSDA